MARARKRGCENSAGFMLIFEFFCPCRWMIVKIGQNFEGPMTILKTR